MQHTRRLAHASLSSSAAELGKGVLNTSSSTSRRDSGPYAAMMLMRRPRLSGSGAAGGSDGTLGHAVVSAAGGQRRQYEPYQWLLRRYVERGSVDVDALLQHPDAPSPVEVLLDVMRHRTPCQQLTAQALGAVLTQPRLTSSAGAASFALQTVSTVLRQRCTHLYDNPSVRVLLCQALLFDRLFSDAIEVLQGTPDSWITPGLWAAVMEAAAEGKIQHSQLLWRLLTLSPVEPLQACRVAKTGQCVPAELLRKDSDNTFACTIKNSEKEKAAVSKFNRSVNNNINDGLKEGEMVTLSAFEVRPASVTRLGHDASLPQWCHMGISEQGYAERHYSGLRDDRAWGQGTLYVDSNRATEGIIYGLDARLASRLMLRANVSFSGQASPLIALHILRRYLRGCYLLQAQAALISKATANTSKIKEKDTCSSSIAEKKGNTACTDSRDVWVHPSPFLIFFKIVREARDVVTGGTDYTALALGQSHIVTTSGLPMIHWGLVWRFFQTLNRESPMWFQIIPEEAADLCQYVIDTLCRGANPWMSLNVARAVSSRHIVDGLSMSLWLLHRLDASHHTTEAQEVTKKVFCWLLVDVGVHLQQQLHHHLIPASRVLIRLGLHEELKQFYNVVLDNTYMFTEGFRAEFMHVMEDLVCPMCSSILPERDVYIERSCPLCLTVVPGKDPTLLPSFQLSNEHIARLREKRKALKLKERRRLHERIYRWSKCESGGAAGRGENNMVVMPHGKVMTTTPTFGASRPPLDAGALFKHEILGDTVPLIPAVSVSSDMPLFPVEKGSKKDDGLNAPFDIHAAMEESSRRLQLQEAAHRYAMAQRGVSFASGCLLAAPPSLLTSDSWRTSLQHQQRQDNAGHSGHASKLLVQMRVEGPWTCVWCREQNVEWSSRVQCAACGAETGPSAPWRQFAYAVESGDVMEEIRARVANSQERPVDAVVASYMLMVFRRAFMLRATPHDNERIDQLIRRLCLLHERVLAGYLYMRFVPSRFRCKNETLFALAQLFGCSEKAYAELALRDLVENEEKFFATIFTPATCKVCFGLHAWETCPIVTRDFSTTTRASINMTPEEKQHAMLQHLRLAVEAAVLRGMENNRLVVDAYTAFVKSPFRELFADVHSSDVNQLSILLSQCHQYRRAAFVLCHIPLHLRDDRAYLVMTHYFSVPADEARRLLLKRSPLGVKDESHPNFVQVALTCCMCLDERHASFECPRLLQWLKEVDACCAVVNASSSSLPSSSCALYDSGQEGQRVVRRLRAQVDGWTSAGPERLHAFYRFLLQRVDLFQEDFFGSCDDDNMKSDGNIVSDGTGAEITRKPKRRIDADDIIVYAINKTITKLATVGHEKGACRLYARTPLQLISRHTTLAMLRMHRFSEEGICTLLNCNNGDTTASSSSFLSEADNGNKAALGASSEAARAAALSLPGRCLLCFETGHAYMNCPELAAQPTTAAKLEYVAVHVGGIRCGPDGVSAAAAYVYSMYNFGNLTGDMLRGHPSLVLSLIRLVRRCFATGQLAAGTRLLRRIPTEMLPPVRVHTELWRAAGIREEDIEGRCAHLLAIYDAEGLVPSIKNPPARQTYSNRFVNNLSHVLHDDLCKHCYQHGHTLATCSVFHAEVSFGRDYVAAYRMSMMSEQLDRDWQDAYLLKLTDFLHTHRMFMPYHIVGVTNALNAIAAMWSFRGEPGIALRHLLNIPPAYRRRQAFRHILHALQVPSAEVNNVLAKVYFSPDEFLSSSSCNKRHDESPSVMSSGGGAGNSNNGTGAVAQHLLMPKPAIRDVAMSAVFNHFPAALEALEKSEEKMSIIRRRNATQKVVTTNTFGKDDFSAQVASKKVMTDSSQSLSSLSSLLSLQSSSAALRVMQSGDILTLREDFDPILTELEKAVGMKLGSRHVLFTSAVDILSAAAAAAAADTKDTNNDNKNDNNVEYHKRELHSSSLSSVNTAVVSEELRAELTEARYAPRTRRTSVEDAGVNLRGVQVKPVGGVGGKKTEQRDARDEKNAGSRSSSHFVSSLRAEKRHQLGGQSSSSSPLSQLRQQERGHKQQQQQHHHHHHHSQRPRYHEKNERRQQQQRQGWKKGGFGVSSSHHSS